MADEVEQLVGLAGRVRPRLQPLFGDVAEPLEFRDRLCLVDREA